MVATRTSAALDTSSLPSTTHHHGTFNNVAIDYTATVAATTITNDAGTPTVQFVTTAYTREGVDAKDRPVLFLFNGGPSSSSATLHMVGLGPKRMAVTQDPTAPAPEPPRLVDNTHTVLDVADLVFIDPPETGFTRALPAASRESLYSVNGDAEAVARFVTTWSRDQHRESSPKFVLGESYGTLRAAAMAGMLAKTAPLDGVYLFGQAVNIVETTQRAKNALGFATNLAALAAVAAYHGKVKLGGKSMTQFIDEVYVWAMHEYLETLIAGRDAKPQQRERVAKRLEQWTGVSAEYYLAHNLVLNKVEFTRRLFEADRKIVATYDARYTGPAPAPGSRAVDPFGKVTSSIQPLLRSYLTGTLNVTLPLDEYRDLAPNAQNWVYTPTGGAGGPFWDYDYQAALVQAFNAKSTFRLMIGTGMYDLTTTIGPARYLVATSDFPSDRVFLRQYEGGHMAYTNEPALAAFTRDVRAFITGIGLRSP
jgi:carboxypeptidase C (cathepsin A)